ncbi:MAG: hypothetical protein RBR54_11020 [Sulfurimonas sp.]|nr:hypothetical protein [Sulfurimonas sp.]
MLEDIKNSIKAKLYDFTYTPFMSSVVVSWIILNHKYLLVYFGDAPLQQKLAVLNAYNFSCPLTNMVIPYAMNIWFPLVFGLFYVFVYPWASEIFYEYTLKKTKKLKEIKQNIEDETPITQEEARSIREGIDRLREARDDALNKLRKKEEEYKLELESEINPITSELNTSKKSIESLTSKNESLKHELSQVKQLLSEKSEECENIKKKKESELDGSKDELVAKSVGTKVPKETLFKPKEKDKEQILEYLYNSYETTYEATLLDEITETTGMARAKARNIIDTLIEEDILEKNSINQISITKNGGRKLVEAFENK